MIYLKNAILNLLTFILIFIEVRGNSFLSANEYLEVLPFFIYFYYIATFNFSRSSVSVLILNGFYFDLFFSDNYLGYTSIKLLFICIIVHFIYTKVGSGIIANFSLFYLSVFLYKFESYVNNFDISIVYLLLICLPNYLLFKALTSNLRSDVFSTKI